MNDSSRDVAQEFIERMGLATEAEGLPRIAGRMFAFLLVDGGPCTFDDFVTRLQVSRGSVSTNTRLLEGLGVLERFTVAGDRQDHFRLTEDPFGRLIRLSLERMQRIRGIVRDARETLPAEMDRARDRLGTLEEFYDLIVRSTDANLESWRRRRASMQAADSAESNVSVDGADTTASASAGKGADPEAAAAPDSTESALRVGPAHTSTS